MRKHVIAQLVLAAIVVCSVPAFYATAQLAGCCAVLSKGSYTGNLATRIMINDSQTYSYVMSRSAHYFPYGYTGNMQVILQNFWVNVTNGEFPNGTQTVRASFALPGGSSTQLTWGGQSTLTFSTGLSPLTDPVSVSFSPGTWVYFCELADSSASPSGFVPINTYTEGAGGPFNTNTTIGDHINVYNSPLADQTGTCGGSWTQSGAGQPGVLTPAAIIGTLTTGQPSVCLPGDSIQQGFQAATDVTGQNANGDMGIVATALGPNMPYLMMGIGGTQAGQWTGALPNGTVGNQPASLRPALLKYCSALIDNYGINDIYAAAQTAAQLEANEQQIWSQFAGQVFHTTLTPYTTATSVATAGTQSTYSFGSGNAYGEPVRLAFNSWLRSGTTGAPGGMFDVEAAVSTTYSGSVVWKDAASFNACSSSPYWVNPAGASSPYTFDHPTVCADAYIASSGTIELGRIVQY